MGDPRDLNRYNLGTIEEILEEWRLNLKQKAAEKKVTTYLDTRNPDYFVDTVQVQYIRQPRNSGLGLLLEELAGGREDGLGITVVTGVVENGPADNKGIDILPGDILSKVTLLRRGQQQVQKVPTDDNESLPTATGLAEQQTVFEVNTEGLCYDETVNQILTLPKPVSSPTTTGTDNPIQDEIYQLTLKRIRRKPRVKVNLRFPPAGQDGEDGQEDTTIELFAGENLRMGMLLRGIKLNDPLAQRFDTKNGGNCGANGLCRTCAVTVQKGAHLLNPQRLNEQQIFAADGPRWRLACKAIVGYGMQEGEITIRVNPNQF